MQEDKDADKAKRGTTSQFKAPSPKKSAPSTTEPPKFDKTFLEAVAEQNLRKNLNDAIKAEGDSVAGVIKAIDAGAEVNIPHYGELPLVAALLHGKFERFKTISAKPPKVGNSADLTVLHGDTKMTLLHLAASLGQSRIVKYLIGRQFDQSALDTHERGLCPIHYAVLSGDCATVDALNTKQQAVKEKTAMGELPIHLAAEQGNIAMVKYLLSLGASANDEDDEERRPAHRAALCGHKDIVKLLLTQERTSRNYWDKQGRNVFMYAVMGGHIELASSLIIGSDKCTIADIKGKTAMHIAAKKNNAAMMEMLHKKDREAVLAADKRKRQPIHIAAKYNSVAAFDFIINILRNTLAQKVPPEQLPAQLIGMLLNINDINGDSVLEYAIRRGSKDIIDRLQKLGVNLKAIDAQGRTLMHVAAIVGNVEMMIFLKSLGLQYQKPDNSGRNPLSYAAEFAHIEVFEHLKNSPGMGFDVADKAGFKPIHYAALGGHLIVVEWLLINKYTKIDDVIDIAIENNSVAALNVIIDNLRSYLASTYSEDELQHNLIETLAKVKAATGETILEYAVRIGSKDIVERLQQLGLDLFVTDAQGCTLLHIAAKLGNVEVAKCLNVHGLSYTKKDDLGRTPLSYAAQQGHIGFFKSLPAVPDGGFDMADKEGIKPIHYAASTGQIAVVEWLLNNRYAELTDGDSKGRNCLLHAARGNQAKMVTYLLRDKKMDKNSACKKGYLAIHHAVFKEAKEAVLALWDEGISLSTPSVSGILPIHITCQAGLEDMFSFLIHNKVKADAMSPKQQNGWFFAARTGKVSIFNLLAKFNVPLLGVLDANGFNPLDYALKNGNKEAIDFLKKQGLRPTVRAVEKIEDEKVDSSTSPLRLFQPPRPVEETAAKAAEKRPAEIDLDNPAEAKSNKHEQTASRPN
jgi:ankyrin repeat protein